MNHTEALKICQGLIQALEPYCSRIAIAGSVRRQMPICKDLEIVCIPLSRAPVPEFGQRALYRTMLEKALGQLVRVGVLYRIKGGDRYKQFTIKTEYFDVAGSGEPFHLDLFIVRPETWGVLLTLRTGPAEFSHCCVTQRYKGGLLPNDCIVNDGQVWRWKEHGERFLEPIETPEELDFLHLLGLGWIVPSKRRAVWTRRAKAGMQDYSA